MSEDFPAAAGGFAAGSRIAGYLLEEQIGRGGMAVVFRAHDDRLERRVALKILAPALAVDQAFRQRFIRESRAAAAVDDPHIIPVFEAGEANGVLFIAMRYVRGGDVKSLVHSSGPLSPGRAAAIVSPVASALDAAHEAGLVHRDVKPANMLLDIRPGRPDHVYLSDFGLSKAALAVTGLTGTGQFLGTLDYVAPEQIEGKAVDGRADQYALACAAFELLTGTPPFLHQEAAAMMYAHLSEPPPLLTSRRPDLHPAADRVLSRALAKAPGDRYPSCCEFADAMRAALALGPYDADRAAATPPPTEVVRPAATSANDWHTEAVRPAARPTQPELTEPGPGHRRDDRRPRRRGGIAVGAGLAALALAGGAVAVIWATSGGTGSVAAARSLCAPRPAGPAGPGSAGVPHYLIGRTLPDPRSGPLVEAAAFSSGSGTLAVGESTGGTYLWTTDTGKLVDILIDPSGRHVLAVAFSCDGKTLAVGDTNGSTYLWDTATGRLISTLSDPGTGKRVVRALAFSPDGKTLAAGDMDGSTYLWQVGTGHLVGTLTDPGAGRRDVQAVAFSPDGKMLAAGDIDGSTYVWHVGTGRLVGAVADPGSGVRAADVQAVAFSSDDKTLAAGDADGNTYLWDALTLSPIGTPLTDPGTGGFGVVAVAFSPAGGTVAVGDSNGRTYLWDIATGAATQTLVDPGSSGVQAVTFSRSGSVVATGDANGSTYLWRTG